MNPELINYLLSSYGLIEGDLSDTADEFVKDDFSPSSKFEVIKISDVFSDVISFFGELQDSPNKHVFFQHTPGWVTMISNSKNIGSFGNYQINISEKLNKKTIEIVDIEEGFNYFADKKQNEIHVFCMYDSNANLFRKISYERIGEKIEFSDEGEGLRQYRFDNSKQNKKFDTNAMTELIKVATKYDLTLNNNSQNRFILIEETSK